MIAVQAAGCAPMVRAWENGDEFAERWEGAATMATGIRVPKAVGDFLILRAVRESGGAAIAVEEEAIMEAVDDAARLDGMLLCPEGGAVLAAWRQALDRGLVGKDERVVLFNCANGNKYPLADRSRRMQLAEMDAATCSRRSKPRNRSLRGSMIRIRRFEPRDKTAFPRAGSTARKKIFANGFIERCRLPICFDGRSDPDLELRDRSRRNLYRHRRHRIGRPAPGRKAAVGKSGPI